MISRFTICLVVVSLCSTVTHAGIIDDLADGEHLWTSDFVGITDSLLEMSDVFGADGSVSFDYEFVHFVSLQDFWNHTGAGKIDVGPSLNAVNYTYSAPLNTMPNSNYSESGNVSGISVTNGDVFYFKANTLPVTHSLSPVVTLEITNFVFTEASTESSAVPEPSAFALFALGLGVLGASRVRKRFQVLDSSDQAA